MALRVEASTGIGDHCDSTPPFSECRFLTKKSKKGRPKLGSRTYLLFDTSISLLERLRFRSDEQSWQRLIELYTPLIRNWLARYRIQPTDLDDLVQEVFRTLVRELPQFQHDLRRGAFRRWLRSIALNRLRSHWRGHHESPVAEEILDQLEDPASDLSKRWDEEHDQFVARELLKLLETEFEPSTWAAFRLLVLEGVETREVATRLNITPNAVRIAKSRVLTRFRQEIDGLVE
jgi:RNA polymerase sigma-70 factor (ECF subfamily)